MALELATLETNLAAAETAYHRLMLGEVVVTASNVDGGSVTYNQANMAKLKVYISDLEEQIATLNSTARRAPTYFIPQ